MYSSSGSLFDYSCLNSTNAFFISRLEADRCFKMTNHDLAFSPAVFDQVVESERLLRQLFSA